MDQIAITRTVTVAAGPFAAGHLGELTRLVPFEMVDDVLAATRCTQKRVRLLPARVVVYLLLAGCLFADLGYRQVWAKLVAGLRGLSVRDPSASALRQARQRLGPSPLRALFDLLRGPAATGAIAQVRWRGLLPVVIDGTVLAVADSAANLRRYVKQRGNHGGSGYPSLRLSALLACGTRSVLDAVFDPITTGEIAQAQRLARSLRAGMLLLADRNYAAADLVAAFAATGADLLIRCKTGRRLPLIRRCPDGSWLSVIGNLPVRIIDARISITTTSGSHTGDYRLITTLLDPRRYPAADMVRLYHQRWEIETAYLELKSTILGGRVLRARTPDGVDQEVHALLIVYQLLRTAMVDATDSRPGLDPDRASFTTALNTARDQVVHAAGIIADTVIDLVGVIGEHVLANLLPDRRIRIKARMIKRSNSKYQARGPHIDRRTYKATTSIDVITNDP
ncbi:MULTISPECIES: IS4 family transposase [Micromonospora]|uniref:IS4 family transposase n=1 Tax=Micromonospora solifontis TaxID=2487138 RepID=A0ABX9W7W3_9ACTN|nr:MULTISPECIES: IS4 family transposase [Micromonospora]NES17357.1 IS4 family transposase [Micromonospora sp. PPF5-17B]NES39857.1 IS4 family transposase [Micromonospora solifontis]NES59213.1 IS4 family transposase [Micromonospora sp. PPF5-6]RNL83562.1 IS4 family transposase [Micromonospora solifontis]